MEQSAPVMVAPSVHGDVLPPHDTSSDRLIASPWHLLLVLAVQCVLSYRGTVRASQLHSAANPDHIRMYIQTMVFEWMMLGLVVAGVLLRGTALSTVLGERWASAHQFFRDLGIGIAFLILSIAITSVLAGHDGAGHNAAQFLLPQGYKELAFWIALSITAGICEEALFRGYLQRQFAAITRNVPAGILISAAAFGAAHSYQGLRPALQIAFLGLMTGTLAHWRKTVRPGMFAHALQDVLGGIIRH